MISFVKVSPGKGGRFIHLPTGLSQYGFEMLNYGSRLFDSVTGTNATCSINGIRYGIVNGVVTQFAVNQPPIEDKGLRGCPAFTQLAKMTETLTDVNWKGFASATTISTPFMGANTHFIKEINIDGTPKKHTKYQDTAYTEIADKSIIGFSFIAKSSNRNIRVSLVTKANITVNVVDFSMSTGVSSAIMAGATASIISLGAGWYHCSCSVSCLSGTTTPILFIALLSGSSDLYIGDGISGAYIGQPTYINFGVNGTPFIPPYVPNNTGSSVSVVSEAATSTTGTSFDLDLPALSRLKTGLRGPNAQGHLEVVIESNVDSGWLPSGVDVILNILNTTQPTVIHPLSFRKGTDNVPLFRLSDGISVASVTPVPLSVGQTFRISLDYGTYTDGTQKMRLTVNDVRSSVVAFSGSFGSQDLRFFFGNTVHAGWIKDLKYYDRPRW